MLKIKDNVDLKELEKFGFEKRISRRYLGEDDKGNEIWEKYDYYSKNIDYLVDKENNYIVSASISCTNKNREIIKFGMVHCKYEYELFEKYVCEALYDLIKADLVEKGE